MEPGLVKLVMQDREAVSYLNIKARIILLDKVIKFQM